MIKQPVYVKFNNYRKPQFNLRTEIRQEKGNTYVYKITQNPKGQDFLESIYISYKKLSKLKLPLRINRCELINKNVLRFDYIEGKNLLADLDEASKNPNPKEFISKLKEFEDLLNRIPCKKIKLNNNFKEIFGQFQTDKEYNTLSPGILDLNLDNIIKNKEGQLFLIDYEWCFDFEIPKRYVFYRTIFNSFIQLKLYSNDNLTLERIEKEFSFKNDDVKLYLKWEENFQNFVRKINEKEIVNLNYYRKNRGLIEKPESFTDIIPLKNKLIEKQTADIKSLKEGIKGQKEAIKKLNEEITEFKSFKKGLIWKILVKYRNIKSLFKK